MPGPPIPVRGKNTNRINVWIRQPVAEDAAADQGSNWVRRLTVYRNTKRAKANTNHDIILNEHPTFPLGSGQAWARSSANGHGHFAAPHCGDGLSKAISSASGSGGFSWVEHCAGSAVAWSYADAVGDFFVQADGSAKSSAIASGAGGYVIAAPGKGTAAASSNTSGVGGYFIIQNAKGSAAATSNTAAVARRGVSGNGSARGVAVATGVSKKGGGPGQTENLLQLYQSGLIGG